MSTFYLDYENGNDANDGSNWANAWKTITSGATAARIAPADVIRIAKSPAPTSIGNAEWTNLSKTVTLASAQTATIDLCESAWTANGSGDTTVALTGVATDAKQGSYSMKLTLDAAPQTSIMQAYYATGTLNLSAYQKISFWIKNSAAIVANNWKVCLCSDTAGATPVDTFYITAIPSTASWLPLTLTKDGGGNLGSSIKSIAIYTNSVAPTASSNILVDDFIACTTNGLNLQSLISKNSAEQGGTEGWYGIQSIDGTTVLLDTDTNTQANAGRGYSTTGTTPETVATYKRETIKTSLASSSTTQVQAIQDSGTIGNNIQFEGGYDTGTNEQTGETFFDGLNGYGYGIYLSNNSYITLNKLNAVRYNYGLYFYYSSNNTATVTNANNNNSYGLDFYASYNNTIYNLTTNSNSNGGISVNLGSRNVLNNCTINETTEVSFKTDWSGSSLSSQRHDQTDGNHKTWKYFGIVATDSTIFRTASPSERLTPNNESYKLESGSRIIAVSDGATLTPSVYVRESVVGDGTDYNGSRIRLIVKRNDAIGITADTVLSTATASSEGAFELLSGTTVTATDDGAMEFVVDCDGTTGWINIDDWSVA